LKVLELKSSICWNWWQQSVTCLCYYGIYWRVHYSRPTPDAECHIAV